MLIHQKVYNQIMYKRVTLFLSTWRAYLILSSSDY